MKEVIDNLRLIDRTIPDYSKGRRRGYSDEESEAKTLEAVSQAIEALERQVLMGLRCPYCEEWLCQNDRYCPNCGRKLERNA